MSSKQQEIRREIAAKCQRLADTAYFTHCAVATGRLGQENATFSHSISPDGATIFDLASLTKALVTVPLILRILGPRPRLSSSILDLSRETAAIHRDMANIQIDALLSHRSGLPAWSNFWVNRLSPITSARELQGTARVHAFEVFSRRSSWIQRPAVECYSDLGFIMLGLLIESLASKGLSDQFAEYCGALNEEEWLGFLPGEGRVFQAISCGFCPVRGRILRGEVHDENCASLGGVSGHAGLFGSMEGLIRFLNFFWHSAEGQTLRQLNMPGQSPGGAVGWRPATDASSVGFGNGQALGHLGFTGTAFWVVPNTGQYAILLTNRIISGRVSDTIKSFRRDIFNLLWQVGDQP